MLTITDAPKESRRIEEREGALPYADEYDSHSQQVVDDLIREELLHSNPEPKIVQGSDIRDRFTFCRGTAFEQELPRLVRNEPMRILDTSRLNFNNIEQTDYSNNADSLSTAALNAWIQSEYQRVRVENLELLDVYGQNSWAAHLRLLEEVQKRIHSQLETQRKKLNAITAERKAEQERSSVELEELHQIWLSAIAKNAEVQQACENLQNQLE